MAIDGGNPRRPERKRETRQGQKCLGTGRGMNSANEERTYTEMANSIFPAGSELQVNIGWISGSGYTVLRLQQDGNLVVYTDGKPAYEAPGAYPNGNTAIMQDDGNFVLYNVSNQPLWASNTAGNPGAYLAVQEDGNVVVYSEENVPLFVTNTDNNPQADNS
jgi:hypothetical protein